MYLSDDIQNDYESSIDVLNVTENMLVDDDAKEELLHVFDKYSCVRLVISETLIHEYYNEIEKLIVYLRENEILEDGFVILVASDSKTMLYNTTESIILRSINELVENLNGSKVEFAKVNSSGEVDYNSLTEIDDVLKASAIINKDLQIIKDANLSPVEKLIATYTYITNKTPATKEPENKHMHFNVPYAILNDTFGSETSSLLYGYMLNKLGIKNYVERIDLMGSYVRNIVNIEDPKYEINEIAISDTRQSFSNIETKNYTTMLVELFDKYVKHAVKLNKNTYALYKMHDLKILKQYEVLNENNPMFKTHETFNLNNHSEKVVKSLLGRDYTRADDLLSIYNSSKINLLERNKGNKQFASIEQLTENEIHRKAFQITENARKKSVEAIVKMANLVCNFKPLSEEKFKEALVSVLSNAKIKQLLGVNAENIEEYVNGIIEHNKKLINKKYIESRITYKNTFNSDVEEALKVVDKVR